MVDDVGEQEASADNISSDKSIDYPELRYRDQTPISPKDKKSKRSCSELSTILDEVKVTSLVKDLKSSLKQTLDSQMATMIIETSVLRTSGSSNFQQLRKNHIYWK